MVTDLQLLELQHCIADVLKFRQRVLAEDTPRNRRYVEFVERELQRALDQLVT